MNSRIFVLLFIAGLFAVTTQETPSGSHHHHHQNHAADKDDIFIDDQEGSAAVSDLDEEASGIGPDDEDTFQNSGEGSGTEPDREPPTVYPITTPPPSKKPDPTTIRFEVTTSKVIKTTTPKPYTEPTTTAKPIEVVTPRVKGDRGRTIPQETSVNTADGPSYRSNSPDERPTTSFFSQPGILAAIIGGAVVGLLCAILLVMFIVYRMRKKDEGSYVLDEPRRSPRNASYHPANKDSKEFFA